ncbi:succinate dehydrogenase cytochrome b subunit [Geopsychrobacter electrodiphilus]|uniref:succinate dehydrogenase cytochrome b subunit n=1 Tax=Geopsychrobacter electrodiphilus TaxID=225196 RepID=UPI00039F98A6|nr:succinate dehydrogenase cytochrome b subunit [Geopsychrobacter electrodiphilus]
MHLLQSTVGRKILMAVTGLLLVGFVTVHLLGNLSIFAGPDGINAYAVHLHSLGALVWVFRLIMLVLFAVHITLGVQLSLENRTANPINYSIKSRMKTTFSSESMLYTGLILLAFLIYHLLHFTLQITNPEISAHNLPLDAMMRPDVFTMVVLSFQKVFISLVYIVGMIALFLHLTHGLSSFVQTFGLNNGPSLEKVSLCGKLLAVGYLLAYVAIPVFILARFVNI